MKIALTSQNRKTVTEHAGSCRKFWVFTIEDNRITDRELLELPKEQAFRASPPHMPHPLDGIDVFMTAGMGQGLIMRLASKGIKGVITSEEDPEQAVTLYLQESHH
jgi:predicted Fe-Mo cluster-binding NifX family protein